MCPISVLFTQKTVFYHVEAARSPAHEVLQHRALPGALAAHHRDLRQLQVTALADGAEGVLQFINQGNQVLHPAVPHDELRSNTTNPRETRPITS